jgi:hypothetical protein
VLSTTLSRGALAALCLLSPACLSLDGASVGLGADGGSTADGSAPDGGVSPDPICSNGCVPVVLSTHAAPQYVRVTTTHVLFGTARFEAEPAAVYAVPKDGAAERKLWSGAGERVLGLHVDGSDLFFAALGAGGAVYRVNIAGPTQPSNIWSSPAIVDVDVWRSNALATQGDPSQLLSIARTGGNGGPIATAPTPGFEEISVEGDVAYLTVQASGGGVRRVDLPTGQLTSFAAVDNARGLVVDATHVYWMSFGSTCALYRCAKDAALPCQPEVLDRGNDCYQSSLAVDASHVYWLVQGNGPDEGELRRLDKGGGPSQTMLRGLGFPIGVAVDERFVYYTESSRARVSRIPKR